MKVKKKLPILVVLVAVAAGSGYWFVAGRNNNPSDEVRVSGNIEITDAEVSFKIAGRVAKRLVDEGMLVQKDQIVAELDSADLAWEVELRRWELKAAEAQLAELQAGSRPDEKAAAKAAMEKSKYALGELEDGSRWQKEIAEAALSEAEAELTRAESEYKRAQSLLEQRIIAKEDFDRRKTARDVALERVKQAADQLALVDERLRQQRIEQAREALNEAAARWRLVEEGPRQEEIARAQARVEQANASLQLAQTRLEYATLQTPLPTEEGKWAVVLSENVEQGEYVAPGTPVVTVGDLENVWLRAYINQTDHGRVKVGQEVRVTTDTYPDKVYRGRVSFIASKAEFTPKNVQTQKERVKLVYRIKVDIPNPEMELKPGMPADAEIVVENGMMNDE